ncbi:MAG: NAD(P)H-dependent oxidoreductase subunit E [Phycisphaerales bacterium]|nr:MAG: NAD(P)H-dependent oxidoreductase subunit E [Phycisphaerales bacterium]
MAEILEEAAIREICQAHDCNRARLLDIARAVHKKCGYISGHAMNLIADELSTHRVEVESLVSFYSFLSDKPRGRIVIRLCNDIIDQMNGAQLVGRAFSEELGIDFGRTASDGAITLEHTACIGMCDQAPAALINDVVVTNLSSDKAREIVRELRQHTDPQRLVKHLGDGNNAHELVNSMVQNNVRLPGPSIFSPVNRGEALRKALVMSPAEVIRAIKTARLRGRGGAGFPTGMKWEFARAAPGDRKFVFCNADEGEPGTFKDRAILTERADRVFAGMTIAGYAIGASEGILYLRGEYAYLRPFLEHVLQKRREDGLLGDDIFAAEREPAPPKPAGERDVHRRPGTAGRRPFSFDIRIQMGAGAYVCGEETALINSCEGMRGDPRNRPPFPAQEGFLGCPTVVNNVETLCCAAKILEEGPATFNQYGSEQSSGTKLLSISGDCRRPGIYEVSFGIELSEVLEMCGARDAIAVQVGGASGEMVAPDQYDRTICFDDLCTGGAIMVFGPGRNVLEIARSFMDFFVEESCGYCTPCRVGNVLLRERLEKILDAKGEPADLEYLEALCRTIKTGSRCGLGQTSANPVLTTLKNFRKVYEVMVQEDREGLKRSFDLQRAVAEAEELCGRESIHNHV